MMNNLQKNQIKVVLEQLALDAAFEGYESGGVSKLDDVSDYLKEIVEILK